jgi:hypothetical protein
MNKKNLVNIILCITVPLLYQLNNIYFKKISLNFLRYIFVCYFNDALAAILILAFSNLLLIKIHKSIFEFKYIFLFITACGCVWEFITPLYKRNSITDYYDFIAYYVGAIIYFILVKNISVKQSR